MIFGLSFLTAILEFISLFLLSDNAFLEGGWSLYFIFHGLATFTFTGLCWCFLSKEHKQTPVSSLLFIAIISLCMPVVGMIGLVFSLILALRLAKPQKEYEYRTIEELTLPNSPLEPNSLLYGAAALRGIISFSSNEDQRISAVNSIRYLPNKEGIPLLKIALNDLSDDVRLLAYSSLDKVEFSLNESIESQQKLFSVKPSAKTAHQIAQYYWELYYLGLADSPLKDHYLVKAREHLIDACELDDLPKVHLLLGKVFLAEQSYFNAIQSLERALEGGLLIKQVAPYLAEAAFMMKNYKKVREYIKYLPKKDSDSLGELREFWSE
jgi:hypothetical protein